VPRRDCSARRGRLSSTARDRPRGDHHAARRFAGEQENLARERPLEAAAGLDRGTDDDELGPALAGDARNVLAEVARARADDLAPHADPVRGRHGGRGHEPLLHAAELSVEVRVERQLALDDERRHEHDAGASVGCEPTG
jgi:hypothetical protein